MALQSINIGSSANDGTGSTLRAAFDICNDNFSELYGGTFKHHQNSAAAEWTINHDLDLADYLPHVTVKMSGGAVYPNIQGMGMVTYVDKDNLKINFVGAHSGYAYLKK